MEPKATAETCPDQSDLLKLLSGSLADDTVPVHVSTCVVCQSELDRMTDSAQLAEYRDIVLSRMDATRHFGPPVEPDELGSLDDLAIVRQIGAGGMGEVFEARDLKLGRHVAVKVLSRHDSHQSDARFIREAQSTAKLRHENVVSVFSTGRTAAGTPYLVMPFIEGPSLKDRLALGKPGIRESADWIRQVALGLEAAHHQGMIHRDVKPANILLDNIDGRAKLTDFGLARSPGDETLTQADVLTGTPQYMSPEQASGSSDLDPPTDIYSLGITLYELLTGAPPFQGQPLQILEQHRATPPLRPSRLNPEVPLNLDTVCLKAIAKEPASRYRTGIEFADDLQRFLDGRPVLARETTRWEKLWMWCDRNRIVAALSATSILLLLALVIGTSVSAWRLNAANKRIVSEKEKATTAERFAINDRNAAIEALEKVVETLYEQLSNSAATIKTREQVVAAAIEALEAITRVEGDLKSDRTSVKAFMRIGDLCFLKGSVVEAEEHYGQAISLARSLLDKQPENLVAQRELAVALSRLSGNYIRMGSDKSAAPCDEAMKLLKHIVAADPDDFDALVRLVIQHDQQLKRIRMEAKSEPQKVIDYGESILGDVERILEIRSSSRVACETAHSIHFCIGRGYLEANNADKAAEHFSAARPYLDVALSRAPENVMLKSASAILDRAHAMALSSNAQLEESIALYESALETLLELTRANPDDIVQKQNVANTQIIMSSAYNQAGRFDDASRVLNSSIDIYQTLIESTDSGLSRFLKVQAMFQLAAIQMFHGRFSECKAVCASIQAEVNRKEFPPNYQAGAKYFGDSSAIMLEATEWVTGGRPMEITASGSCLALMISARRDAKTSTDGSLSSQSIDLVANIDSTFKGSSVGDLLDHVHELKGIVPFVTEQQELIDAQSFGLLAKNASRGSAEKEREDSIRFLNRSISSIKKAAASIPPGQLKNAILNDPDLAWVRETDEFKQAWSEISGSNEDAPRAKR